jgi:parvulin-like peptidyl-prolyl isomerase
MSAISTTRFFATKQRVAALLAVCALVAGCSSSSMSQRNSNAKDALAQPVATVNDHPIPVKVYEMYLKNGRDALGLDPNSEEGRRKLDQLREGIVSELIDRTLIREEAERRGLVIPSETMADAERKTIADLGGEERYNSYLAEHGFTRDEYREIVKSEVYGEQIRNELNKGLSVSDEEIKKYYQEHRKDADFQQPERVTAAHILVAARPNLIAQRLQAEKNLTGDALAAAGREEMERLRRRAEELKRKAAKGTDFAQLARESSDDSGTRDRGGDLGTFTRESHARAFDDAAFAMKPGQVGDVVQTDFGFHVIKVFKHDPARGQTLAEATPEIRGRLLGKLEAQKLTDWLKAARRNAKIHINEPYRFGALKTEFP